MATLHCPESCHDDGSIKQGLEGLWEELATRLHDRQEDLLCHQVVDQESLEAFIAKTKDEYASFRTRRRSTWRSFGKRMQTMCENLSNILQRYAGIADCLKTIHPQGGPLLYGVLSIIITVVGQKERMEKSLETGLARISSWFGDVTDYQNIWSDSESQALKNCAYDVYANMFRFVMGVWDFYSCGLRHRIVRVLKWQTKPIAESELEDLQSSLQRFMGETRKLLHKRVKKMESKDEQRDISEWKDYMSSLRYSLRCSGPIDPGVHCQKLKQLQRRLANAEDDNDNDDHENLDLSHQENVHLLERSASFKWWLMNEDSCMVILRSVNRADSGSFQHQQPQWISAPLADHLVKLQPQTNVKVLYHAIANAEETPAATIAAFICNMLEWDQTFFRQMKQSVENVLGAQGTGTGDVEEYLELIQKMLMAWCEARPDRVVYFVIDRFDKYFEKGSEASMATKAILEHFYGIIRQLSRQGKGLIKICFHVGNSFWPDSVQWKVEELTTQNDGAYFKDSGIWHQRSIVM